MRGHEVQHMLKESMSHYVDGNVSESDREAIASIMREFSMRVDVDIVLDRLSSRVKSGVRREMVSR